LTTCKKYYSTVKSLIWRRGGVQFSKCTENITIYWGGGKIFKVYKIHYNTVKYLILFIYVKFLKCTPKNVGLWGFPIELIGVAFNKFENITGYELMGVMGLMIF
jgi:hypothetical protein